MKAINIKWDANKKELKTLPTEIEIPYNLLNGYDGTNFETYYPDISDWLTNKFSYDHYGFEITQ